MAFAAPINGSFEHTMYEAYKNKPTTNGWI